MTDAAAQWERDNQRWRDPSAVIAGWEGASEADADRLAYTISGTWWETLHRLAITLVVGREYEHLLLALTTTASGKPYITTLCVPHPGGIAYDAARGQVHIALTRNPNQVLTMQPLSGTLERLDMPYDLLDDDRPLLPVRSAYYPGSLYMHDLAMIGGELYANAVGHNAVVRLCADGRFERVWHPRCIEQGGSPVYGQNHIQLNSIAAGADLASSYFSASADELTDLRPGDPAYPVNKRGVIFSGTTREPIARGLTRPHSARLHDGTLYVANSGYGELVRVEADGALTVIASLPGWTRGVGMAGGVAFVGTSRVIPRFRAYAPGLDVDASVCGVHALELTTGRSLGSITWAAGNQLFGIEALPRRFTTGFPFALPRQRERETRLFYTFLTGDHTV